jgi:hypothetical protein
LSSKDGDWSEEATGHHGGRQPAIGQRLAWQAKKASRSNIVEPSSGSWRIFPLALPVQRTRNNPTSDNDGLRGYSYLILSFAILELDYRSWIKAGSGLERVKGIEPRWVMPISFAWRSIAWLVRSSAVHWRVWGWASSKEKNTEN